MGKYSHVYVCSTKRIDSKKIEKIQDEEGKIYTIFDNVHKKREKNSKNNSPKIDHGLSINWWDYYDNNMDDLIQETNLNDIVPQMYEKGFIPKCKTATNTVFKRIKQIKYKLIVCTRIKSLFRQIKS